METLYKQIESLVSDKLPMVSNLSNVSALLFKLDNLNWAGFYLADENGDLYLGPFQGDVACNFIPYGRGVCGTAVAEKKTIIVPDVNKFDGHIACSSLSKSEIVVPVIKDGLVYGVIDIDSPILDRFHKEEKAFLERVAILLAENCFGK